MLLLLQLLLLLLLVFSLARPFIFTDAVASGNIVVVLDASASMQATDEAGGESRFDRAREEAGALVDGLGSDSRMTIIWAGPSPRLWPPSSGDKSALHAALKGISASNGTSDMPSALTLASAIGAPAWQRHRGAHFRRRARRLRRSSRRLPPPRATSTSGNLRPTSASPPSRSGTPRTGPSYSQACTIAARLRRNALLAVNVDGQLRDSRSLQLGPNDEQTLTLQGLPLDTKLVEAKLTVDEQRCELPCRRRHGLGVAPGPARPPTCCW